nr:ATP synthase F0 subunit 8 [Lepidostoma basale]UOU85061.1 ATP synthase F0 subunit 8 [Lepidostoma basale]
MPQMMPISWIILFLISSLMYLIFLMMNYHIFPLKSQSNPVSIADNNDIKPIYNFWPLY